MAYLLKKPTSGDKLNILGKTAQFDVCGLPQDKDPKLVWALSHPEKFPLEINRADFWELLRVPGIGRTSAQRIIEKQVEGKITRLEQLKATGCVVKRARNFVTLNGKFYPFREEDNSNPYQLFLWEEI